MVILVGVNIVAKEHDKPGTLMVATHALLMEDTRCDLDIHKETGLPFYWLRSFRHNEAQNPSVNRVEKLYEFLSGKKIIL